MKTVGPLLLINGQLWDPRRGKFISSADPAVEAHVARSDPHTQYRLESEGHSHQSDGLQGGTLDHGLALTGLLDDDHTQYIRHSLATAINDFLVASGAGAYVKKTLAETQAILGLASYPSILSTTTGIDAKVVATINLYTVPAGKSTIVTSVIIRVTTADTITAVPALGIGIAAGEDDIIASTTLTGLDATTKYWKFDVEGTAKVGAAAEVIKLGIDTGATATTMTIAVDLIGYLVNA